MTSASNIIYENTVYNTALDHDKTLLGKSLTTTGAISSAGVINTNAYYAINNVRSMDITANGALTEINIGLGWNNAPEAALGFGNIGIGSGVEQKLTTGTYNNGIGSGVFSLLTTGANNVAVGRNALASLADGSDNTMLGHQAGAALDHSGQNIAVGSGAMKNSVQGAYTSALYGNTCVGYTAGQNIAPTANSRSIANTVIGSSAGTGLTDGSFNTFLGASAGATDTTGDNNTCIGSGSNVAAAADSKCLVLGYNALGAGSGTTVIQPLCMATGTATSHILGYNSTTGQVFKSTTVTPQLTVTGGTIVPAGVGYQISSLATQTGAAGSVTNNDRCGYATYTAIADTAAGNSVVCALVNSAFIAATSKFNIVVNAQTVAATACFSYKGINSLVDGTISFIICNVGAGTSGAAGAVTVFYQIFN